MPGHLGSLSSRLFACDLTGDGVPRELPTGAPVIDPQLDPTGRRVAYAGDRALRVVTLETGVDEVVVGSEPDKPAEVSSTCPSISVITGVPCRHGRFVVTLHQR